MPKSSGIWLFSVRLNQLISSYLAKERNCILADHSEKTTGGGAYA